MVVENLTVADVAYPFVMNRVMSVFQQQLIHVQNGCTSDDPDHLHTYKLEQSISTTQDIIYPSINH